MKFSQISKRELGQVFLLILHQAVVLEVLMELVSLFRGHLRKSASIPYRTY